MSGPVTFRAFAAAGVAACLILAAPAAASTIGVEANTILNGTAVVYRAAPGEANAFSDAGFPSTVFHFQDIGSAVAITPIAPCVADPNAPADPRFAQCPTAGITGIGAFLGDSSDVGVADVRSTLPVLLDGGADNDSLSGAGGNDLLLGGTGNDTLLGEGGDDILDGGPGADDLNGNGELTADLGFDIADYGDRVAGVTVTLDGLRNDGEPGEGDLLTVEMDDVNGGSGADTIVGDAKQNLLIGNDGPDTLTGGGESDVLDGGNGNDTILARDGIADTIDCGPGADAVTADTVDVVVGCEAVDLPAPPAVVAPAPAVVAPAPAVAAPPAVNPRDLTAPALALRRITAPRLRTALRRGLTVRAACSEACTMRGVALFGGRVVARGSGSGGAGVTRVVRLRFTRSGAQTLRRHRTVRLTVRLTAADSSGNRRTVTRSLGLRR